MTFQDQVLQRQGFEILRSMVRIRLVEEAIAERYGQAKMRCPTHLSIGQECISAVAGLALRPTDYAVSGHRAHGHYLGKGGSLKAMLAEIYGKKTGCASGKGGSMHLIDESVGFFGSTAIVGGTIPVGVGLALSAKLLNPDRVSCIFLGDGACEEGVFFESVNFAVLKQLPVIFICENNLYSVYSHLRVRQPENRRIYQMVQAMGMESKCEDGNDAISSFRRIEESLRNIRSGKGPQFLEFSTYRWREHCGPNFDNDIGYRTEQEYLEWKARDPIPRLKKLMEENGLLNEKKWTTMNHEIMSEIEDAFLFAEKSPFPDVSEVYTDLYSETNNYGP